MSRTKPQSHPSATFEISKKGRASRGPREKKEYINGYKKHENGLITILISFCIYMTLWLNGLTGQIPTGSAIIDSMTAIMSPENSRNIIKQTNHYDDGKTRTFVLEMYSAGKGDKMMMRYIKPTSVKGQTFLLLNDGDDIWTYFPRTRRVRKMASHAKKMKVQGGDFSFDDFSSEDTWKDDYTTNNTGSEKYNGTLCWKLKAVAKPDVDVDYPEIFLWIGQDNYYPLKMDYMDAKENIEKTLLLTNIQNVDGFPTAMLITMENHITGTKTVMETVEVSYDWNPPKGFFSERNLKK